MKRVMIIGSPGTGKSTFAKRLAAKTDLPLQHIDYYYHDSTKRYHADKTAWEAFVLVMISKDKWIIDGNYGKTMAQLMKRADTIIYFDMPRRIAVWGVIKRRIAAFSTTRTDMPIGWKETANWRFLQYVWRFRAKYATQTEQLLANHPGKTIVRFHDHKDVADYLNSLK